MKNSAKRRNRKQDNYLIELRLNGRVKKYAKRLIFEVSEKFHVYGATHKPPVPHSTLFGPFQTRNPEGMVETVVSICKKYDLITYKISGFNHFDKPKGKVIYLDIDASPELQNLRRDISKALMPFCTLRKENDWDRKKDFQFHITIAFKDIDKKFKEIFSYLKRKEEPQIPQTLIRVTIIRNGLIFKEFDLLQRWAMTRDQAKDKDIFRRSLEILRQMKTPSPVKFNDFSTQRVFFISDTHFDHANVIKYTKRPFRNVEEMNQALVLNWNNKVKNEDLVFFLGDLGFGRGHRSISYWLEKLNGKIYFLKGNHDSGNVGKATEIPNVYPLSYKGHKFLLMHDPHRPIDWDGWIIHGDKHNNDLENYPFFNGKRKTINVSVEVINFAPIDLEEIIAYDLNSIKKVKMINKLSTFDAMRSQISEIINWRP